jgi:hypothetical protein
MQRRRDVRDEDTGAFTGALRVSCAQVAGRMAASISAKVASICQRRTNRAINCLSTMPRSVQGSACTTILPASMTNLRPADRYE